MKEWLEIIRDHRYFNLLVMNTETHNVDDSFSFRAKSREMTVQYEEAYEITKTDLPDAPNFIAVSAPKSLATKDSTPYNIVPHAADPYPAHPNPAQKAGNIAFIWGKKVNGRIQPHRENGFPAVIIAVALAKYYQYGELSRRRDHPAIKAEHLVAMWFDKGDEAYRANGPTTISFDNYKEFWIDGEYGGQKWTEYHLEWNHRLLNTPEDEDTLGNFLSDLRGETNMFTDQYFVDAQDDVCYLTDFA